MQLRPVVACLLALILVSQATGQEREDAVYLKNGGIIRGIILEQIPGESLKIQTQGGNVFVHVMDEIEMISIGAHDSIVHLKNGSVIRGRILEQTPGESLKIQTQGGSVFVHMMEEIARITGEPAIGGRRSRAEEDAPGDRRTPLLPYLRGERGSGRTEVGGSDSGVELGILFGVSRLSDDTGSWTMVQLPGGGVLGRVGPLPSLHVSWLTSEQLAIGPEFAFWRTSYSIEVEDAREDLDLSISAFMMGGRAALYPAGNSIPGIYLLGQGSLSWLDAEFAGNDESETDYSVGFGMGYQWRIGPALVLRMEAQYRRWLDSETDNYSLVLGLGTRLGGS